MSDIVLVYPPVALKGRYKKIASGHEVPPQPLIYLGAVLRENNFRCSMLDANALGLTIDETVERILEFVPKYVGFSAPTMLISTAAKVSKRLKEKKPDITTIVGGPHISAVPKETMLRYTDFDIGVIGEGEITINELLISLENKKNLNEVKGIIHRQNEEIIFNEERPFIEDLDSLPFPGWDMLPNLLETYQQSASRIDRLPCLSITTSRGCPLQCIFCARNVFGNISRAHSTDYLIKMIKFLQAEYRLKSISIEDENFVIFRKRLVEFCSRLIEEDIDITWDCASSVNSVNPEILKLMKKAGCWQINYGIESGSQRILDFIKKGTNVEEIKQCLKWTKEAGITTKGYFIIGHPTETIESIKETFDFIQKIDLDIFQISFMTPFPGSELYDIADQYGEFQNNWDDMNIWTPLFIPKGLTKEDLIKESNKMYQKFYLNEKKIFAYLKRMLRPTSFFKFIKDGFKILRFVLSKN